MKFFIAFLLVSFISGGTSLKSLTIRRPLLFAVCCGIVAMGFLSLRVIG
jgi:hypothetical protein